MDEAIRIYNPVKQFNTSLIDSEPTRTEATSKKPKKKQHPHLKETESKWKFFCDGKIWSDVIEKKQESIRELQKKYTWFPIMYNWLVVFVVVALFVSFGIWGVDVHTKNVATAYAEEVAEQKDAEHQAFLDQQEADRKAAEESLENLMKTNAQVKAKLGYGSRNFIDKYHYGDSDIMTLYQCLDNRMNNSMYTGMTIDEIAFQEGQFIASYNTNPVQDYYFNLAMKSERLKNDRVSDPVGTDYVYTIYTEHGLYLANDPKAPAYTWWHYSE